MNKTIASATLVAFASILVAPAMQAGELADELHRDHQRAGQLGNESGKESLVSAGKAVVYAGKAVINGIEFVVLKTAQGTILVLETATRGLELAAQGVRFVAVKAKEGVIWVCEKAIEAGEILRDVAVETIEVVVDGVIYVAANLEEGIVFVAKKTWEVAQKTGEIVVKGAKFVVRKTKEGIIWVADAAMNAARATRRAALVSGLRMNLSAALAVGGVGDRTISYFNGRAQDGDPCVARLAKACLIASEAFNSTY